MTLDLSFGHYVLDENHIPRKAKSFLEWAEFFEQTELRRVAKTETSRGEVSTVFLGIDHNFGFKGPPILFETMVFGGPYNEYMERYCTWAEAEEGHAHVVKLITTEILYLPRREG